jgi:hypothetical protein
MLAVTAGAREPAPDLTGPLDVDPPPTVTTAQEPGHINNSNNRLARAAYEPECQTFWTTRPQLLGHRPDPRFVSSRAQQRIIRRARAYQLQSPTGAIGPAAPKTLCRILGNGSIRMVPPKADRLRVIKPAHRLSGHFNIRRTSHLLLASFWWRSVLADVASVVNQCKTCDRIRAQFDQPTADLQSLPTNGLFFRWGVDASEPFTITRRGNKYIMHAIEFFSAVLVLEPIPTKESRDTACAFQHNVLERFGSCAEILTYNCSQQASTRCSPYHLLYTREPVFPSSAARDTMQLPLALDTNTPPGRRRQSPTCCNVQHTLYAAQHR